MTDFNGTFYLQALVFGKAKFGMCIPSTCDHEDFEEFINDTIANNLGPMFYATVGNYHYTSTSRPWTNGDIIAL